MSLAVESLSSATFNATALLLGLLLPVLGLWYSYYWLSRRRLYELAEKIPGPPGTPFIGNLFEFLGGPDRQYYFYLFFKYKNEHFSQIHSVIHKYYLLFVFALLN
jgi:hypothetical protein